MAIKFTFVVLNDADAENFVDILSSEQSRLMSDAVSDDVRQAMMKQAEYFGKIKHRILAGQERRSDSNEFSLYEAECHSENTQPVYVEVGDPTPYAVLCNHGKMGDPFQRCYLTEKQYDLQMSLPDNFWICPVCGDIAIWDDDNWEKGMGKPNEDTL